MQAAMQAAKLFLPSNVNLRLAVAALTRTHTSPAPPLRATKSDDKHVSDVLVAHEDVPQEAPTAYADCHTQSSRPHDGGWRTIGRGSHQRAGGKRTGVWSSGKNPTPERVMLTTPPEVCVFIGASRVTIKAIVGVAVVGVGVAAALGDGVGEDVGDGVGADVGDGVGEGVGDGVGEGVRCVA